MQHTKITIDFIGPRGNLIGYWSDYVPKDCDADGLIDYLYDHRLVPVNWDKVRPVFQKKPRQGIGWHRIRSHRPLQLVLAILWVFLCYHYIDLAEWGWTGLAVAVCWGLSWIIYIGARRQ